MLAAYARDDVETARATLRRLAELKEAQRLAAASASSCAPARVAQVTPSTATTVKLEISPTIARAQ